VLIQIRRSPTKLNCWTHKPDGGGDVRNYEEELTGRALALI